MLKLANQIIDVHDDVTREGMKKLARINPHINVMGEPDRAKLPDHQFALTLITKTASKLNKFPIADLDSTWLSNEYFDMNWRKLPSKAACVAASHIKEACEKFGLNPKPSVVKLASAKLHDNVSYEVENIKPYKTYEVADIRKFASVEKIASSYTNAQYAFSNPTEVKLGSKYFSEKNEKMPLEMRHKYASALQRRAKELGMPALDGEVAKYASDHYSGLVDAHLRARASLLDGREPEYQTFLSKLGSSKKEMTPQEFATALYQFDKKASLVGYYGSHLTDPYRATFAEQPDPYEGARVKVGNKKLTGEEIRKVVSAKADKIKDYFGPSMLEELKKEPVAIFESLPMDAKEIIAGMLDGTV